MTTLSRRSLVLAVPAALAGCGGVLGGSQPPPQLYTLTPARDFPAGLPNAKGQLLVEVPVAPGGLDTERIALMRSPVTLDYFANAAWTDRAPLMVQTLLVESFENSGKIGAIGRESLALRADWILKPELRDFTAVYDGGDAPTVRIRLALKLVRMPERGIVSERTIGSDERAAQNAILPVVEAFDAALRRAMQEAVAWAIPVMARG
ncbi:MAG TPA: ABC-type transport auxiliary lipoprotein family protein [Stellaceae bacterium]|nr:ABC-type transport auxiliary lipoprotein family protein [Stellaceae bacterium]